MLSRYLGLLLSVRSQNLTYTLIGMYLLGYVLVVNLWPRNAMLTLGDHIEPPNLISKPKMRREHRPEV